MAITQKTIEDIYDEIYSQNSNLGSQAIPHSDQLLKNIQYNLGISPEDARTALRLLVDSHKLFSFEITAEDAKHDIEKIEGFIVTDPKIVPPLKNFFQDLLCQLYEKQFHKHLLIHQVIKEMFPIIKSFNNTEIGQIANKTIMLMEYERLFEKNPIEYTEEFKEHHLYELAKGENIEYIPAHGIIIHNEPEKPESESISESMPQMHFARATDSSEYKEFSEKKGKYPLQRILSIYGIDFYIKVYMRKCEFLHLKKIVEDRQITRREDLLLMKQMVEKIKSNALYDKTLQNKKEDLYALERAITHAMYFTSQTYR